MKLGVAPLLLLSAASCAPADDTRAANHNSTRSNRRASITAAPDSVLPMVPASAVSARCVEVQVTAGDDDPDGRAAGDPVHGVDVKLGSKPEALAVSATTDDGGVAHFCDLRFDKRGAFVLTAESEGAVLAISDPVLVVRAPRFVEWLEEPVAGHAGVPLRSADGSCPAVRVRAGQVMAGGVNGSSEAVAYRAGDPIHGVDVKLGAKSGAIAASATTDSDGVATFCNLVEASSGVVSYEPWTVDDSDEGIVSNPLYQPETATVVSPLFEGRATPSSPILVGPFTMVVVFTIQPPWRWILDPSTPIETCPSVSVYAAAGFSLSDPLVEAPGAAQVGVTVTVSSEPGGASTTVTTGADGSAALCNPVFGEDGAYVLRASVPGARSVVSAPFSLASIK